MTDPRYKTLKIKTGVVRRLTKEKASYEVEVVQLEERLEKMKADGKDEHDIKKQYEVLQESRCMVPDTLKRLKKAAAELNDLLEKENDLAESEEYIDAKRVLEIAEPLLA
uniref:Tubulin-specific chaperone A n=1 Tax=Arion vulgaris TaxID=1028688 RepID=A0A0B7AZ25_9EUPU